MKTIQTVSFIGAGNVASHLATSLFKQDIIVHQICTRSIESSGKLATQVNANPIEQISDLEQVDCIVISVPDDSIEEVIAQLPFSNQLVAHTSGIAGLEFDYSRMAYFYPLQSFRISQPADMSSTPIFIGAKQSEDIPLLEQLANRISNRVQQMENSQKKKLHLAAVVVNNFVNYLFGLTNEFLSSNQLDFTDLKPIIQTTIDRAMTENPFEIQTGPAKRGDKKTIASHLQLLSSYPEFQQVYECISSSIENHFSS